MIRLIAVCNIEHVKISWFGLDSNIGENNIGFVTETFSLFDIPLYVREIYNFIYIFIFLMQ